MSVAKTPVVDEAVPVVKPLRLRTNISWTFSGNFIYSGCQWGMLTVLAKLGTPSDVGLFGLGLAVTAPVMMFTNLQLRAIQATDARNEYRFIDYFLVRILATVAAVIIISILAIIGGYGTEARLVILAAGLAKAFESVSDVVFGLLQQNERMDRIAISMMAKGPLSLLVLAITFLFTHRVLWSVVAMAITWGLLLILYDLPNANRFSPDFIRQRYSPKSMYQLAWLCLPMGFVSMLYSLNANVPRYFIERLIGIHELGLYAAIASFLVLGTTVISALGQSASPRLSRYYIEGKLGAFNNLLFRLLAIGFLIGVSLIVGALLAGRFLITVLYTSEYARDTDTVVMMMVAGLVIYIGSVLTHALTATRTFGVQLPINLASCSATALFCWILVQPYGLRGAALALLISAIVLCVLTAIAIRFHISRQRGLGVASEGS